MAYEPIHLPHRERFSAWFLEFLKKELAPYPGRGALMARIIISATLTMILIVTFRIPGGVIGALSAFILSRENLVSTARSVIFMLYSFLLGALFIPVGARLFASTPETHFLWVGCSLFLAFFLLRCLANYAIALGLAIVVANVVGIWYLPGPAETNVELTLWLILATAIGALVTLGVEVVFHALYGGDVLVDGLETRLALLEELMADYANGRPVSPATQAGLAQFVMVGTSALRGHVTRANYTQLYRTRMTTLVSLVARSIDFGGALAGAFPCLPQDLRPRAARVSQAIADICNCLRTDGQPIQAAIEALPSPGTPFLSEIESMVSLMLAIFSGEVTPDPGLDAVEEAPAARRIFVPDVFSNPDHLRYILAGTTAAMLCYIFYVSLDWRNLQTSLFTCVITALTTIGASRQKQTLRVAGFLIGGVIAGLGSQIFILASIDSITGFTVLFATVTAVAAWVATSSTRLSYAGVQIAFSFYLIQLSDFSIQTNLTIARDRALGVLLGITMMWLVFERVFPRPAADEMVRVFIVNLRLLADFSSSSPRANNPADILKIRRVRDEIYRRFGEVNAQADAVPFETGPLRARDMAARDRIRRWMASVRSFYLFEVPLVRFRVYGGSEPGSQPFMSFENDFRFECAHIFRQIADSLESQRATRVHRIGTPSSLVDRVDSTSAAIAGELSEGERSLIHCARHLAQIIDRLQSQVASEGLYDLPETSASFLPTSAEPDSA
jgi:multidrug resistance protein MdtO